jgi:hypothetical protein
MANVREEHGAAQAEHQRSASCALIFFHRHDAAIDAASVRIQMHAADLTSCQSASCMFAAAFMRLPSPHLQICSHTATLPSSVRVPIALLARGYSTRTIASVPAYRPPASLGIEWSCCSS